MAAQPAWPRCGSDGSPIASRNCQKMKRKRRRLRARRLRTAWKTNRCLPVLPILHQISDHGRIGQGGSVAQRVEVVLGDLAQDAAHDLAAAGLGKAGSPLRSEEHTSELQSRPQLV